jgi:murein DD-endopeptidase MepM/ murein hydrolase activator NlpD
LSGGGREVAPTAAGLVVSLALVALAVLSLAAEATLRVVFHPARLTVGEVGWVHVRGAGDSATVEGSVGDRSLTFFPYAGGHAALVGIDLETRAGVEPWRVAAIDTGASTAASGGRSAAVASGGRSAAVASGGRSAAAAASGTVVIAKRAFPVQRLTLPEHMVELDPETERRAISEAERLRTLYRTITGERLWRGPFIRPVAGAEPGTGFGSRRIINGRPRMPHGGADYAAPRGTPIVAANAGRVALVGDFFFPGRTVVVDHGLGLYTLYFHLERAVVEEDAVVGRGQIIGTVGATGRATGPHLHFGVQVGAARVDPAVLLKLAFRD